MSASLQSATASPSPSTLKLSGKIVVVTAATSGMALATAKLFVAQGAYVFITGRRQEALDAAVKEINEATPASLSSSPRVTAVQGDAADLKHLDALIATVRQSPAAGHIDVLFASAGFGSVQFPLVTDTEKNFDETFNLNVRGTYFLVQKALPLLREGASVILNGSVANQKATPGAGVYSASKAAERSFVRTWTAELTKSRKIRFNILSPGPIDTNVLPRTEEGDAIRAGFTNLVPMGRIGQSSEIASAALFLASTDSSFITGAELCVDGGFAQV